MRSVASVQHGFSIGKSVENTTLFFCGQSGICCQLVEFLHNSIISLLGDLGKRTAPGLLSLCVALLECLAHGLDLVRVTAGQSIGKLNDTVGSLVHTPVTVLGDICLRLCLGSRIYGEISGT